MNDFFSNELVWWITAVDIPAFSSLLLLIWRTRRETEERTLKLHETLEMRSTQMREALSAFKLEVAKNHASHGDVRELEKRIVRHLVRIEAKLDTTALKTEGLAAGVHTG